MTVKKIPGGYSGQILRVNLSDNSISTESLDGLFCRKYIGGSGFILYYLLKELRPGVDPLGVENKLIFATGPVTGTNIIGGSRNSIGAKSPMSGGIGLTQVGEFWGAELKRAGYDALIIEGKADKAVYLWINDGEISIREASHIWGRKTKETQQAIRSELNDEKVRVAMIGPAGEKTVRFACIMNGPFDAAGRGGMGAVMGSKNLKAIAVKGNKAPIVVDPERLKEIRQWWVKNTGKYPWLELFKDYGTGGPEMEEQEAEGNLPVRNWRDGLFPEVKKINAPAMRDNNIWRGKDGCYACPIRCKKRLGYDGEPYTIDEAYGGPEYESIAALGSNCGLDNVKAIVKGNELCNAYSMDTISTGGVIAFAMECFERGLLTTEDTGGIELKFGNDEAMLQCIELIARREGFGDVLADGVARLAQKVGNQSKDFAMHVKGLEVGMHEPRLKKFMGLNFMVNPAGGDHNLSTVFELNTEELMEPLKPLGLHEILPADYIGPRKVALWRFEQLKFAVYDCLVTCAFIPFDYEMLADITASVTGWDTGVMEQLRVGERVLTMARLFNIREGFTADDDKLPRRYFQPKTDGVLSAKGLDPEEMEEAKRYYYTLMGWDANTGIPLPEKLEELGINDL